MKQIFISTNEDQPANCFFEDSEKRSIGDFINAQFKNGKVVKVLENIYLIHDDLDSLTKVNVNDCLLYHNNTKPNIINQFSNKKKGHHTACLNGLYLPVFKFLLNIDVESSSTYNDILTALGFTNDALQEKDNFKSKLNLLHKCLSPDTLETINESDLKVLNEKEKSYYETFKENVRHSNDPFDGHYVKQLTSLRSFFLKQK